MHFLFGQGQSPDGVELASPDLFLGLWHLAFGHLAAGRAAGEEKAGTGHPVGAGLPCTGSLFSHLFQVPDRPMMFN
jgi:hypothetical protein